MFIAPGAMVPAIGAVLNAVARAKCWVGLGGGARVVVAGRCARVGRGCGVSGEERAGDV
jgi:hypothetical protein